MREAAHVQGKGVYKNSLYFVLSLAMDLKLLKKKTKPILKIHQINPPN